MTGDSRRLWGLQLENFLIVVVDDLDPLHKDAHHRIAEADELNTVETEKH